MELPTNDSIGILLRNLLTIAWLLPLAGFVVEIFAGYWSNRLSKAAAYLAVLCIGTGFVCSSIALYQWGAATKWVALEGHGDSGHGGTGHAGAHAEAGAHNAEPKHDEPPAAHAAAPTPSSFTGTYYTLARRGPLVFSIDYYIDSLTLVMFTMVTLIATCIHVFAIGYMSEELTESYEDHQVHTSHGHFHRPGRFYRFFAFLSLFSFSMLGLVIAGNIFLVFVFWELVGVCSYFLIGFYFERKSASTAANKAFIMNRVGDFGFLIGLMIIWTWFGTFQFADQVEGGKVTPGLFTMVRGTDGLLLVQSTGNESQPVDAEAADGQPTDVKAKDAKATGQEVVFKDAENHPLLTENGKTRAMPYYLLVAAGIGIFAGCIGKSAQFPLQTWLPDAMEGPTPVSALVHSATMVAAGVYLAGRFYPMFTTEVLLTMAYIGCITLFLAATIAVVATDIKRVLAYSTISQLGYMMLGLGLGGWGAGLFHLITHAFFKSLLFLCSGSVIYGCHHVQEMPQMGGLRRKMPVTAFTMLIGVIAISGLAVHGASIFGETISVTLAFSGYHSKDAILATALTYMKMNRHPLLFALPLAGAAITAFYMFRLWFYTFAGTPRDRHVYDHAREAPAVMLIPLVILSIMTAFCAMGGEEGPLFKLLIHSEPKGLAAGLKPLTAGGIELPGHAAVAINHSLAGAYALGFAFLGTIVAYLFYGAKVLNPDDVRKYFSGVYTFLVEKWRFDELYDVMFVKPTHVVARWCATFDRVVIDGFLHGVCKAGIDVSLWDRRFDEGVVDGLVNLVGNVTFSAGRSLKGVQTGLLRNYVMFIALGILGLFALFVAFFPS